LRFVFRKGWALLRFVLPLPNHSLALITVQPSFSVIHCKILNNPISPCYSLPCLSYKIRASGPLFHRAPISASARKSHPPKPCNLQTCQPSNYLSDRHVTKNPSPQPLYFPHLQTVTPVTPLDSALTQTAGSRPPLSATLMEPPRKCCKQTTYANAKPFSCNTYKRPEGGRSIPIGTRSPRCTSLFGLCETRKQPTTD
jgi:hypothetical protein